MIAIKSLKPKHENQNDLATALKQANHQFSNVNASSSCCESVKAGAIKPY